MRAMRLSFKEAMIGLCVGFVIAYLAHEFGWNKKSDGMEELNRAFGDPPIMSETDIDTIDSICKQYGLETESEEEHLSPGICLRVYTSKDGKDALTVI